MRVKICGVRTLTDAIAAVDAGADAIGLNCYPGSPRFVDEQTARQIVRALPPFVTAVGVVVNPSASDVLRLFEQVGLSHFQCHRTDAATLLPALAQRQLGTTCAYGIGSETDLDLALAEIAVWSRYPGAAAVQGILVDAKSPDSGVHGGTGLTAPWELLAGVKWPYPVVLAGGLTPSNVAHAIRTVRPYAVDVASGVESAPGIKDGAKMRSFVQAAASALN